MSRVAILAAVAILSAGVATLTAGEASAQAAPADAQAAGLRYLAWNGRSGPPATPTAGTPSVAGAPGLRRPNLVIPHGGFSAVAPAPSRATTAAAAPRQGLTPANAWMRRPAAPDPARPVDAVRAAPPAPAPVARLVAQPAVPARPTPEYLPNQGGRGQPAPAEAVYAPAPAPIAEAPAFDPADPMAPRRDAPVFRMQRSAAVAPPDAPAAPEPAPARAAAAARRETAPARIATVTPNTADRPTVESARYYSVHRQDGRQPDPIAMPEPTYVDALAISVPESLASQDLAQPAEPPTMIRDGQGHLRAAPAASDGDHQ